MFQRVVKEKEIAIVEDLRKKNCAEKIDDADEKK